MDFTYQSVPPIGEKAVFGLIVLSTDESLEVDMQRILAGVGRAIYVSRIASATDVTPENLGAMADGIAGSADLFPKGLEFSAIGYGCTSASSVIGSLKVDALIRAGVNTKSSSDPVRALKAAADALQVQSLAVLSPYVLQTSNALIAAFEKQGLSVLDYGSFNEVDDNKVARIDPHSIRDAAIELAKTSDADAIFLSCTNLRTLDVIEEIEAVTGRPVLSSNQVLAWHMANLAGVKLDHKKYGKLFFV